MLKKEGANLKCYDPKAMENFKTINNKIYYANNIDDALKDSDLCIILTEWKEFKNIYEKILEMKKPRVIDGRRVLDKEKAKELLLEAGYATRKADGTIEVSDKEGKPLKLTLITNSGNDLWQSRSIRHI